MSNKTFRRAPVAHAVVIALAAAGLAGHAHAQRAFSAGWMAQKNMAQGTAAATGYLPNGTRASLLTNPQAQQQQASEQLQRSINNLNLAAQAIAAQQAAQAAARQAALQDPSSVPDGLADGGLKIDTNSLTAGWANANAPGQSQQADGRTNVAIQQTGDKAVLNWETFNVGKRTTVEFKQQADWAVLNRVNDPQARPSQIQGQIKADGTVLIANRNGIVFSGSSQTDTRNLVAAAAKISDEQFKARGIYSAQASGAYTPSFTDAGGSVTVEAGAQLATRAPTSVKQGGGYVLLMGQEVNNAGTVTTPRGQAQLAAGDFFVVRPGQSTTTNPYATTRGNEVAPQLGADSSAGTVTNTGLLQAPEGDITLAGRKVVQDGVALATTTVDTRGTIHLLNSASDKLGSVTVTARALNAVLLDDQNGRTALDSQRDALVAESAVQDLARRNAAADIFDNLARLDDRRDRSRIEIVSGGGVVFEGGSSTLATGGQVAVSAATGRSTVANGARLDVSGAVGVQVAMSSNNVEINIQGNEQRDAPLNRDTTMLNNSNVWIDRRKLVRVAAGVGGYDKERWYTSGGLLEVGGYLGLQGHTIGEWSAQGGSVVFAGNELVTQQGSSINLSGGTLDVQTGMIRQSWLKGADGRLYEVSNAPADVSYTGLYKGFEDEHKRWGDNTTGYFYNPLIGPQQRLESGYTVGRDAGQLVVSTKAAVLEGDVTSTVYQGPRQTTKRDGGVDGYAQSHDAAPLAAQLVLGSYTTAFNTDARNGPTGVFQNFLPTFAQVVFGTDPQEPGDSIAPDGPLPQSRKDVLYVDSDRLNGWALGALTAGGTKSVTVDAPLAVVPGGGIALHAPQVNVNAGLTAHGGDIALGNVLTSTTISGKTLELSLPALAPQDAPQVTVARGVVLDASGLWSNLQLDGRSFAGLPYVDGGNVSIRDTGAVTLSQGSVIDVSSGAALLPTGALRGGAGGDIALAAAYVTDFNATPGTALLTLDGELRGYGVNGGGTLNIQSGTAVGIGGSLLGTDGLLQAGHAAPANLRLLQDYQLAAGERLPMDLTVTVATRPAGYTVADAPLLAYLINGAVLVTHAEWVLPPGAIVSDASVTYLEGSRIPAGTALRALKLPVGATVPADAFPDGVPIYPTPQYQLAGTILSAPLTLPAGSVLSAGAVLSRPVGVAATGRLAPSLFQSGFANYVVTANDGITVLPGTQIDVNMPVLLADADAVRTLPAGGKLSGRLPLWTPPLYIEDPVHATLTQRGGASIELDAGSRVASAGTNASLIVGTGARIAVDPGQNLTLWSDGGQVTVDGRLDAWGGTISIASLPGPLAYMASPSRSIWIGDHALLDAAARPYVAHDTKGRAYGIAPDGGAIDIGLSDSFVVIRPGAVLDASGAFAEIDGAAGGSARLASQPLSLAGNGGSIGLHSYVGMAIDGSLSARAGGAGAAGGSLTLEMANRSYNANSEAISTDFQTMHNITLMQQHAGSGLSADLAAGETDPKLKVGAAILGVDQVRAGGFDALTLSAHDLFIFEGDIDLSLGRSLNLRNGFLTVAVATPDAQVRLAAPTIRLDGGTWTGTPNYFSPGITTVRPAGAPGGNSALTLAADLIDLYGTMQSGVTGVHGDGTTAAAPPNPNNPSSSVDFGADGFATVALRSDGDIRFSNDAALVVPLHLSIEAAQIYPASGQRGMLLAGFYSNSAGALAWNPDASLVIRSNGHAAPIPDSVFGRLVMIAPTLDQGGIVRAPLGTIALNDSGAGGFLSWISTATLRTDITADMRLILRDGSLTSVSAAGLTMPYGGTSDGLTYRGADDTLYQLGVNSVTHLVHDGGVVRTEGTSLPQGISLGGGSVVAEAGALLDLSGGGDLRGAGFISGRGGSVDVLTTPLANANPLSYRQSRAGNAVYAIVPGYASDYAPLIADKGAGDPAAGRQITIGAGVPGLPAGTYTLLPASFALMPNAWRVEIGPQSSALTGARAEPGVPVATQGSWTTSGTLSTANTGTRDNLPSRVLVSNADAVRHLSQYNETSYADFAIAQAAQFGNVRPMLPADGKILRFRFMQKDDVVPLQLDGTVNLDAAAGGIRGQVSVLGDKPIEIVGGAARPTAGAISLSADTLSSLNAGALSIGGLVAFNDGAGVGSGGARISFSDYGTSGVVQVRGDATLRAAQIFLMGKQVTVDGGATLDTRGMGQPGIDSSLGFLYSSEGLAVLAVSNGWLDFLPAGGTGRMAVKDDASLLSEGTIAFAASGDLALGDVNLGARYLTVSQDQINIGTSASLVAAQAAGTLQPGWQLTQDTLNRLLRPSASAGVPALERLSLTAGGAFNFYGSLTLDTGDSSAQMVFNTPAFYGLGAEGDVVRVATRNFVWNGIATGNGTTSSYASGTPAAVQPGGPGTGLGSLIIDAQTVQFGYDAMSQPQRQAELDRLALGFGAVTIRASDRVTSNNKGALSVGQSQDAEGTMHGGALSIVTPLLTGGAGAAMRYAAGGAIDVSAPSGASVGDTASVSDLGASLTLQGSSVAVNAAVALPSGVLKLIADGDVTLGDSAHIDLAGRGVTLFDITKYSWGGDVTLSSATGSVVQATASRIDVSAAHNDAGSLTASAAAGNVALGGALEARGGGEGFADGRFGLTVSRIADADFTVLNQHLNGAGFFDARSFVVKQGDLTVGDGVRAHQVNIATDGGSLTVNGLIDASGSGPGRIDLAANNNLTLTGRAVLDVHGKKLFTDSYGTPIDASNRAKVSLTSIAGTVQLDAGATFDLSSPDGIARGRIEINAPRVGSTGASATGPDAPANATGGDIAISAAGPLNIRGAQSVALNGIARYTNAPADPDDADGQVIDQAYLDRIDSDSRAFDNAARSNAGLQARIAGLAAYGPAFHLRPGVEIDSKAPDGNLTVKNDLDLSGYRYGPDADRDPASSRYGAGEPMSLVLRAGGDLTIHGSINDGFAPPPVTPDDGGWQIRQQVLLTGVPTTRDTTFDAPFNPDWGDVYYVFPSAATGVGYPVVVSGSVTDGTGAIYLPGDTIPGFLYGTITVATGTVLTSDVPGGADILLSGPRPTPGQMWSVAPLLAAGSLSASIRLVSGADLAAADTRSLRTPAQLAGRGNMVLDDLHQAGMQAAPAAGATGPVPVETFSVVRTGTGDLDLYVGGDYQQNSLFGVYTAGTSVAGTGADAAWNAPRATVPDATDPRGRSVLSAGNSAYENTLNAQRLWFTENGGDFTLSAHGDIRGYLKADTVSVGDWLWRQGGAELGQRTAWGLNFGSYVLDGGTSLASLGLAGYAGVGALGGGNAMIRAGGNIGVAGDETKGLLASIGGSGRMTQDGALLQTGGGTLDVRAGGLVSGGLYVNLRGDTRLTAADAGSLVLTGFATQNTADPRAPDPYVAHSSVRSNAVNFAPGDGKLRIDTLGDLVLGSVIDPGRVGERSETEASAGGASGSAASWFTLWTDRTALNLFSAGGNASPFGPQGDTVGLIATTTLPANLSMVAAGGSIYYSTDNALMAPSPYGHLDLLANGLVSGDASNSNFSSGSFIGPLGTSAAAMSTPQHPGWRIVDDTPQQNLIGTNHWQGLAMERDVSSLYSFNPAFGGGHQGTGGTLFMFGPNTVTDNSMAGDGVMSHIYALTGDVIKVQIGQAPKVDQDSGQSSILYQASKPLRMLAGGDIVNSSGLIVQDAVTDVSMIAAQGDVIFSNFSIAGPGTLEVSAGGQVFQGNTSSLTSLGALVPGDLRLGANIVVQSSLGKGLPGQGTSDFSGFAKQYLDPAQAMDPSKALADQPGKVVKTYDGELTQWLHERFGYAAASSADAQAYFEVLAPEQQRIFVRQVYFAELTAGGREFNDSDSNRFGSYLRGRNAIAALFPEKDVAGNAIARSGDLTLFQGTSTNAGIRTIAGGDIQILTPGGKTVIGVEGIAPASDSANPAGLLTQGEGSIQMYSQGSILLGLSRIMTTFGGDILAWSATGDINAGRGSKTTLVYTPPKREYDPLGNVKLSPNVPSTGAGIATLDSIPEVPPGDVDLIAPLGTIDAGEAGIRVSGNVNLAALQVVNAANIQVQGKSTGLPVVASVNVGALTNASAAAAQATIAAQDAVQRERATQRQALPSVFTVRVLGFGDEPAGGAGAPESRTPDARNRYDADSPVQVLGRGQLAEAQKAKLTAQERRLLGE